MDSTEIEYIEEATDYSPILSQILEEQQTLVSDQQELLTEVSKINDNTTVYICTLTFIVVALGALLGALIGLTVKGR